MSHPAKVTIIVFLLLIIVVLAAASLLVYYQGRVFPVLNKVVRVPFLEVNPATAVRLMQKNMLALNTASYSLTADIAAVFMDQPTTVKSTAFFVGGYDAAAGGSSGRLETLNNIKFGELALDFDLNLLMTPEKSYWQFSRLPRLAFADLSRFESGWHEGAFSGEDNFQSRLKNFSAWLANSRIFEVDERLPDEPVGGQPNYHYLARLNERNFSDGMKFLSAGGGNTFLADGAGEWQIELWIGKNDYYLNKLTAVAEKTGDDSRFSLVISDFNQPLKIDLPVEAQPLGNLATEIFQATNFLELPLYAYLAGIKDESIISDNDGDGLYAFWEEIFGTDPENPDSDGDGYPDGDEVISGHNPYGPGRLIGL